MFDKLSNIFNFHKKEVYDPATAHVLGVDEELREQIINESKNPGDPTPSKSEDIPNKKIIFQAPGIKITR